MLNILDIEDLNHAADQKTDEWLKEAQDKFMQPYTDTALAVRLTNAIRQVDPQTAEQLRLAFGGEKHAS